MSSVSMGRSWFMIYGDVDWYRAHSEAFQIFLEGVLRRKPGVELADSSNCRGTLVKFWSRRVCYNVCFLYIYIYINVYLDGYVALASSSSYILASIQETNTILRTVFYSMQYIQVLYFHNSDFWWNSNSFFFFFFFRSVLKIHLHSYRTNLFENDGKQPRRQSPWKDSSREFLLHESQNRDRERIYMYIYTVSWERGKQHASGNGQDQWPSAAKRS